MRAIAIDLGGSHATVGIVEDRKLLASREIAQDAAHGLAPALPRFVAAATALLSELGMSAAACDGLAMSFCGLVDYRTGRVVSTDEKYDDAVGLDLVGWCREAFGLRFAIENDARMALLGEVWAGAAQGCGDVVMMTMGTGLGGAAMMEGRLVRGKHLQGGCLGGHLPVLFTGRKCTCGAIGCT
ncbi:MAG TPA: ROK family protein, partial [Candidatus Xenobia bacterium]